MLPTEDTHYPQAPALGGKAGLSSTLGKLGAFSSPLKLLVCAAESTDAEGEPSPSLWSSSSRTLCQHFLLCCSLQGRRAPLRPCVGEAPWFGAGLRPL